MARSARTPDRIDINHVAMLMAAADAKHPVIRICCEAVTGKRRAR
jgi:hypothetical protein